MSGRSCADADHGSLRLRFDDSTAGLSCAQQALRRFVTQQGAGARVLYRSELVLEELVTNVIRHAYAGRQPHRSGLNLLVSADGPQVTMVIEDDGPPFDPLQQPQPPAPAGLADARIGGLGLPLVRESAAQLAYQRVGNLNRVTILIRPD